MKTTWDKSFDTGLFSSSSVANVKLSLTRQDEAMGKAVQDALPDHPLLLRFSICSALMGPLTGQGQCPLDWYTSQLPFACWPALFSP